jgi:hypothetical protein
MRPQGIAGVIVLCVCASGCRLASDITHNLVFETCLFVDEVKGKVYYRMLARSAWKAYRNEHPEWTDSADFAKGFKLGYADYLENGDGSSHPLPPLRYWKVRYETHEGRAATVAWLEGFQAGTAAAKASGYRELIVVPVGTSSLPPDGGPPPPPNAPPLDSAPATLPSPPGEELPAPRSLPAEAPAPNPG